MLGEGADALAPAPVEHVHPAPAAPQPPCRHRPARGLRDLEDVGEVALIVHEPWLSLILDGRKTWEIRGMRTRRRGTIHLARARSNLLLGRVRIVDCLAVTREELALHAERHHVRDVASVPYRRIFAWVLAHAEWYAEPRTYTHPTGAIIWVRL